MNGSHIPRKQKTTADLSGAENYLISLVGALAYPVFPNACRPPHAEPSGTSTRISALNWVTNKVKENLHGNGWTRADSPWRVADVFTRVFPQMGKCRFRLYTQPPMAREGFEIRNSISARLARNNNWPLSSPGMDMDDINPAPPIF